MSTSTVSATVQDPSGQIFANGTWQLFFKTTFGTPGMFTDGGIFFTQIYGGSLDATGSFSQPNVNRNDTILPAGSRWTLTVKANTNNNAFSVDLNVNSGAFNASSAINAVIANISVPASALAHAYKDSEVVPNDAGSMYYDVTLKVLKVWDSVGGTWQTFDPATLSVLLNPPGNQIINQPAGTNLRVNRFEQIRFPAEFAGADGGAKINAADADLGATPGEIWVTNDIGLSWTTAVTISANHTLRFIQSGTYTSSASPMITLAGPIAADQGARLIGSSAASTILLTSSATADIIQITGNACYVSDVLLRASVIRTAGAGINCKGGGAYFENVEFNPVWNGVQCNFTGGAGISGKNFLMRKGGATTGAWNCGILLGGQASGSSTSECFFVQGQIAASNGFPFADAGIVLDAGTDTIKFTNVDVVTSGGGGDSVCVKVRFSGGTLDLPRISRFIGCSFEAGITTDTVDVTACKDLRFIGCQINAGLIGLSISSANVNTFTYMGGGIAQSQNNNVSISASGLVSIFDNNINGASQSGNGSFDSILVAANTNNFWISGNNFNDQFSYANHPNFNVNIAAGTSNHYGVVHNIPSLNSVSGFISDNGTGGFKTTSPNDDATGVGTIINKTIFTGALASGPWTPAQITGNFSAGDLGCARSSTSGLMYFGTDANIALFRSGATLRLLKTGATVPQWQQDGLTTIYNQIATVSGGIPAEYATVDTITNTANVGLTTAYAVPATGQGMYRVSGYVIVNRVATTSSTLPNLQIQWTDPDNSTVQSLSFVSGAPTGNVLTTFFNIPPQTIMAKLSTNIQYQTGNATAYASVGGTTMQYSIHLKVEAL